MILIFFINACSNTFCIYIIVICGKYVLYYNKKTLGGSIRCLIKNSTIQTCLYFITLTYNILYLYKGHIF